MTNEEAISDIEIIQVQLEIRGEPRSPALDMAVKALRAEIASNVEPLTDTEQRIFLSAMIREEKICKEVCEEDGDVDLVRICRIIQRKVKKALWS